jgi:Raf kinase inhibitor-like YbhB/YbcL family protein
MVARQPSAAMALAAAVLSLAAAMLIASCAAPARTPGPAELPPGDDQMDFRLTSQAFDDGGEIPARHTCDGEDVPPPLEWSDVPAGTAELAVIMDDADARGFIHWVVVGIPADSGGLPDGRLPARAREGANDFGRAGYGGPCPPSGSHRYVLTLYALSQPLQLSGSVTADAVRSAAEGKISGEARLEGRYARR